MTSDNFHLCFRISYYAIKLYPMGNIKMFQIIYIFNGQGAPVRSYRAFWKLIVLCVKHLRYVSHNYNVLSQLLQTFSVKGQTRAIYVAL